LTLQFPPGVRRGDGLLPGADGTSRSGKAFKLSTIVHPKELAMKSTAGVTTIAIDLAKDVLHPPDSGRSFRPRRGAASETSRQASGCPAPMALDLADRRGFNKAAGGLANKVARILWATWKHDRVFNADHALDQSFASA
jgi:hypothetical protein